MLFCGLKICVVKNKCLPLRIIKIIHIKMQVSKVIKKYGCTIEDVAKQMGVKRITLAATISTRNGEQPNPTVKTLRNIANAINEILCARGEAGHVHLLDFFADEQPSESSPEGGHLANSATVLCPHCGKPLSVHIKTE